MTKQSNFRKVEMRLSKGRATNVELQKLLGCDERNVQVIIKDMRENLYRDASSLSRAPYTLREGLRAFPEDTFGVADRKTLLAIVQMMVFFDVLPAAIAKDVCSETARGFDRALSEVRSNVRTPVTPGVSRSLVMLYRAMTEPSAVTFGYRGQAKTVSPYTLRQHNGKWYLLGRLMIPNPFDWSVFVVEEMKQITFSSSPFHPSDPERLEQLRQRIDLYYQHVVGLHVASPKNRDTRRLLPEDLEPAAVVLKADEMTARFLRENPIHSSQHEGPDGIFTLAVVLNYPLKNRILSYGAGLEVMEPEELRRDIAETAVKMLGKYGENLNS